MTVRQRLIDLVKTLPKPDHRQVYRTGSARVGMCFLDLGITNSHIVRESESLHMSDRDFLSRTLNLDVSLSLLTHDQYTTAKSYSLIRRRPNRDVIPPTAMSEQPNLVWVPITHTDRMASSNLNVVNQAGDRVPLLTQTELLELFDAAFISLLELMLRFAGRSPDRGRPDSGVFNPESPSRWLVEAALTAHLYRADIVGSRLSNQGDGTAGGSGWADDPVREGAVRFLHQLIQPPGGAPDAIDTPDATGTGGGDHGRAGWHAVVGDTSWVPFLHLLEQVRSKQFIVVGLDAYGSDHSLTFSAPDLPNRVTPAAGREGVAGLVGRVIRGVGRAASWLPGLGTLRKDHYIVEYTRPCKTSLQAFHLDFEADDEVNVRTAVLLSDRDVLEMGRTVGQLRSWSSSAPPMPDVPAPAPAPVVGRIPGTVVGGLDPPVLVSGVPRHREAIRRYERRRLLLDGLALVARRRAQLARAKSVVPFPRPGRGDPSAEGDGEPVDDRRDEGLCDRCPYRLESIDTQDSLDEPCDLMASCLEHNQMGLGVVFDDDPRPNRAHVFWRASRRQLTSRSATRSYEKRVRLVLADDAPSLLGDVLEVLTAILIAVVIIAWFLVPDFVTTSLSDGGFRLFGLVRIPDWAPPPGQRLARFSQDAVVAILLLAPGLLLSRLEMPRGNRLLAHLRTHSKRLAYGGALAAALLAIVLATTFSTEDDVRVLQLMSRWVAGALLLLLVTALFAHLRTRVRRLWGHRPVGLGPVWTDQWLHTPGLRDVVYLLITGRQPEPPRWPKLWVPFEAAARVVRRMRYWVFRCLDIDPSRPDAVFFAENPSVSNPDFNLADGRIEEKTSELIVAAADRLLAADRATAIDVLHEPAETIDVRQSTMSRLGDMVAVGRSAVESRRRSGVEELPVLGRKFVLSTGKFAGQVVITSQRRSLAEKGSGGGDTTNGDRRSLPSVTVTNEGVDETFYFGGRVRLEFFVVAGARYRAEPEPSRELALMVYNIASCLLDTDAAFVFCEWPAAWPPGVVRPNSGEGPGARDVSRLERHGVRFAIDLPRSSKISGVDELERIVEHIGGADAIWILDGRDSRSSWKRLLGPDGREPHGTGDDATTPRPAAPSGGSSGAADRQRVLPISLVGSLRIGTTSLLLESLLTAGCEVVGFSERWIDGTLVFNVTLAVDGGEKEETGERELPAREFHYREDRASEHRNVLAGFVATNGDDGSITLLELLDSLGGVWISPPMDGPFHNDPEGRRFGRFASFKSVLGSVSRERMISDRLVVWCRWDADVRSESVVKSAVSDLRETFQDAAMRVVSGPEAGRPVLDVEIEYLELAPDGPGRMSGFAQVSIGATRIDQVFGRLTEICLYAEDALTRQLAERSSIPTEVHVSWDRPLQPSKYAALRS